MRGETYNRERAKQLINYSGVVYGNITPTDIDGLIEYRNWFYIMIELKHDSAEMPEGQSIALARMIKSLNKDKPSILFVASHDVFDPRDDIDAAEASIMYSYDSQEKWSYDYCFLNLKEAIDLFLETEIKNRQEKNRMLGFPRRKRG